jgi:hypothetical protein
LPRRSPFRDDYRALEDRFRAEAERDGDPYLPNVEPDGPVPYVFIAQEPSFGRWAGTKDEGRRRVAEGFRNFVADEHGDVVLLHHAIRRYLATDRYLITDLSKGAMFVKDSDAEREARWERWFPMLRTELDVVGPDARVYALGGKVERFLRKHGRSADECLMHYSVTAQRGRKLYGERHPDELAELRATVTLDDILQTAEQILAPIPAESRDATLRGLRRVDLSQNYRYELLLAYKLAFEGRGP